MWNISFCVIQAFGSEQVQVVQFTRNMLNIAKQQLVFWIFQILICVYFGYTFSCVSRHHLPLLGLEEPWHFYWCLCCLLMFQAKAKLCTHGWAAASCSELMLSHYLHWKILSVECSLLKIAIEALICITNDSIFFVMRDGRFAARWINEKIWNVTRVRDKERNIYIFIFSHLFNELQIYHLSFITHIMLSKMAQLTTSLS